VTRVLVLNLYYPPHHLGGYEASCADVMRRLSERGHDVAVLTSSVRPPGAVDPEGERDGPVPVWRDLTAYVDDGRLLSPPVAERWRIERWNQRALRRAIDRHRPEVISVWQMGGLSLGLLTTIIRRRLPVTYAVCDDWLSYSLELDAWNRLFRRLPRPLVRLAEAVLRAPATLPDLATSGPFLFVSELTRQRAAKYGAWPVDDSAIVHSGIDRASFSSPGERSREQWGGRLLYAGRYDPRKGIETAIRALGHLEDAVLVVRALGDPAEQQRLEALTDELGLRARVEFGACARGELAARYRAADLVVFPSEWEEPFGLVPLEAMACGVPVAGTGVGGSGQFLLDGVNCVRFRPGDPLDLAAAVRRVADDAALRAELVAGGLRTAEVFDVERLADEFEAWHAAAADRFAHGRPPERAIDLGAATDA
jgi:glycosyltransferase involved in cell wall biosynthesis